MFYRAYADRRAALIGATLLCAAAAGCTAGPPAPEDGGPPRPVVAPGETAAPAAPETASTPPPAEPVIDPDPKRLDGKDATGLAEILGKPAFRRIDGPATLLRWRSEACVLDAFLYPPRGEAKADPRVSHVEARSVKGDAMKVRDCFAALLRARAKEQKAG